MDRQAPGERDDERLTPDDRDQPAGRVLALALGTQLRRYQDHAQLLRTDDDPEHLHRARVALRRGRSIARQAEGVIAEEELELLRALMGEVAAATSTARDLDVLVASLDRRVDTLPTALRAGRVELHDELGRRRSSEQQALADLLDGPLHLTMLRRWQRLANPYRVGGAEPGPDHLCPAGEVVDERLRSSWRALRRAGRRSVASGRARDWHRTRKRAKQVRYLLDATADLYPDSTWSATSKHLGRLQNGLGELQDLDAGTALLVAAGGELRGAPAMTAGGVAAHLADDRRELLERADSVWARFDRPKVRRRFNEALTAPH